MKLSALPGCEIANSKKQSPSQFIYFISVIMKKNYVKTKIKVVYMFYLIRYIYVYKFIYVHSVCEYQSLSSSITSALRAITLRAIDIVYKGSWVIFELVNRRVEILHISFGKKIFFLDGVGKLRTRILKTQLQKPTNIPLLVSGWKWQRAKFFQKIYENS